MLIRNTCGWFVGLLITITLVGTCDCWHFTWKENVSQCSTTCGYGTAEINYQCYSKRWRRLVDDEYCRHVVKPLQIRRPCHLKECKPTWEVGLWEDCSVNCGLGVVERSVTCVQHGNALTESASFQEVSDEVCMRFNLPKPPAERICPQQNCSHWRVSRWSFCSSSSCASSGFQHRRVRCLRKLPELKPCDALLRPKSHRICTPSRHCLGASPKIAREYVSYMEGRPMGSVGGEYNGKPTFHIGHWSRCSKTCGSEVGLRYRVVQCRRYFPQLGLTADVSEEECRREIKPRTTEICYRAGTAQCGNQIQEAMTTQKPALRYEWIETGFSTCSTSCGGGFRKNLVMCFAITDSSEIPAESFKCADKQRPMERFETCGTDLCQPEWKIIEIGQCSVTCGSGVKTQTSKCIRRQPQIEAEDEIPEFMCKMTDKPASVLPCHEKPCELMWKISEWSEVHFI